MKKILGLDLGTSSIGWALVNEAENTHEKSSITKLGVRVIQYDTFTNDQGSEVKGNPADFFSAGKSVTPNAARTQSRSMRRNLQRYKLRRNTLISTLRDAGWISKDSLICEQGPDSTHETLRIRALSATQEVSLEEFARVLLHINKKRGYKSSRKADKGEDGSVVDGLSLAKELYEKGITPGQYVYDRMLQDKFQVPDFYRSDLRAELDKVWQLQQRFYPDQLSEKLRTDLEGKSKGQVWKICEEAFGVVGMKRDLKGKDLKRDSYRLRATAAKQQVSLEELTIALQEICDSIRTTSGYLGNISDRSKELYFNKMTVGQKQWELIRQDRHHSLKNEVYFRQDYLDEFERIWETQAQYHPELTSELKKNIRDIVIFYQRPLRSQKGLISLCEFEHFEKEVTVDGKNKKKTVGLRVCPKSSPLFQEFKIWQVLNNLKVNNKYLDQEQKQLLFNELNISGKLSEKEALGLLFKKTSDLHLNFKSIEGNNTQTQLFDAYFKILEINGYEYEKKKRSGPEKLVLVKEIFESLGFNTDFLFFNSDLEGEAFSKQPMYELWHVLYSFEGDKSLSGNQKLVEKIKAITNMDDSAAKILAGVTFASDYGSLSTKAMRKILPYMKEGNEYSLACQYAGYRHSAKSLTREELDNKQYKDYLDILPKNSLRNPVVEKILNQMINVVNEVSRTYGKPDEIRIELARELKKSAKERQEMSDNISKANLEHEKIRKELAAQGYPNPSRTDIIRYKLYKELETNGYHTLYTNTYIPFEKLFGKDFDIEHIIPKARLFDDSFSNKTLELRQANIDKSNQTAYDFVANKYGKDSEQLAEYEARVDLLFKKNIISKAKRNKLLMTEAEIPQGFIERDLRETQYIAKLAKSMLEDLVRDVVSTTGSITDRLREDWQLVDMMKELNYEKYEKLGLTEIETDKDGRRIKKIKDWTKRNDHRHHAMDALTIAFTKRSYIQYLNNLNARVQKSANDEHHMDLRDINLNDLPKSERSAIVRYIETHELFRDSKGKLRFNPPMPMDEFRSEARKHMEDILISIKAKSKVTTRNVNVSKRKGGVNKKVQLTPRGQLHQETVYGMITRPVLKEEKVGANFNMEKIESVSKKAYRTALLKRLAAFEGDPKKAFTGKNSLDKQPIFLNEQHTEQVPVKVPILSQETIYTKREAVSPDLKVDKVIDANVRRILEARLAEYNGDAKLAFSNLEENPIWLNRDQGIRIKRVTISGKTTLLPIHDKRNHRGELILDKNGQTIPTDYVSTGSNHHIAIYADANGNLQEQAVSFLEAVTRVNMGVPVIDREYNANEGWTFLFTMKQNEYFVFPNPQTGFDPNEVDLMDPSNYAAISPNLFRVQKLATKYYVFRHHLETTVSNEATIVRDILWKRITAVNGLKGAIKVRINHLGKIVAVGEY